MSTIRSARPLARPFARTGLALALLLGATAAHAQVKLEITPHFTSYYATNELRYVTDLMQERQEAGPGIGANVTWRFTNIWAVEATVDYIRSGIIYKDTSGFLFEPPTTAHLVMLNARVIFQPRRTNLYFSAGMGTVQRGGEAFEVQDFDDLSDVAAIVGIGVRTRVTPQWGFRLGVEVHQFTTNPDLENPYYAKRTQRDVLVTIGVPFALIGR